MNSHGGQHSRSGDGTGSLTSEEGVGKKLGKRFASCWDRARSSKPVEAVIDDSTRDDEAPNNRRRLIRPHLIIASLAFVIGAGIIDSAQTVVHDSGGLNSVVALAIAAIATGAAVLCFAELASTIPVSGSTYTYAYTAFGQACAWMVAWTLLIEYSVGAFVVALRLVRFAMGESGDTTSVCISAAVVVLLCSVALARTPKKWGWPLLVGVVAISVVAKMGLLLVTTITNFHDRGLIPLGSGVQWTGRVHEPKWGVDGALGVLYFSFVGFDGPSTAAEDSRYPQRDLAPSIGWSFLIVTVLYFAFTVSGGLPGPLSLTQTWLGVLGLLSGVLMFLYGQGRILRAVVRDGLFSRNKGTEGAKHLEVAKGKASECAWRLESFVAGVISVGLSGLVIVLQRCGLVPSAAEHWPRSELLIKCVSVATGVAFAVVAAGTLSLRRYRPDRPRTFTAPFLSLAALITVAACGALIYGAREILWYFVGWVALGALAYLISLLVTTRASKET